VSELSDAFDQLAAEARVIRDGVIRAFGVERLARWLARRFGGE
jgi:hypothetical protein